jgi:hypothetical protein
MGFIWQLCVLYHLSIWILLSPRINLLLSLYWLVFQYIWLKLLYSLLCRYLFIFFRCNVLYDMFYMHRVFVYL